MFDTPILFIIFNRPDVTSITFEVIKRIKPKYLYISGDGARLNKKGEIDHVNTTRDIIINGIDWDCELKTLFRETNYGCRNAVSSAISWFFENVEQGIILEDDCLPNENFFYYCEELLELYKYNSQIMLISGDNFQNGIKRGDADYYFSRYNHIWGWASWKRAWNFYDVDMKDYPMNKKENFLKNIFKNKKEQKYWYKKFDGAYNHVINTWDYQWTYAIWKNNGISILPNVNLISNIGFIQNSTHTFIFDNKLAELPTETIRIPLTHAKQIKVNSLADAYTFKKVIYKSFASKIIQRISNFFQ